tara:strand:- start:426 stop:719 length:294 start_codon:yes stop_codon:yes gene_type:complete
MVIGKITQRITARGSRFWTIHKNGLVFMKKVGTTLRGDVDGFYAITSQLVSPRDSRLFPPTPQSRIEAMRTGARARAYTSHTYAGPCTSSYITWSRE